MMFQAIYAISKGSWFALNADFISIIPVPDTEYFIQKTLGKFIISEAPKEKEDTRRSHWKESRLEEESQIEDKEGTSQQAEEKQDEDDDGDDDEAMSEENVEEANEQ